MKRWKEKDIFYFDEYYPYWIYNDNNEVLRSTRDKILEKSNVNVNIQFKR